MNDFEGLLGTDFGFKPSNKSTPMAAGSTAASTKASANLVNNFDLGSRGPPRSTRVSNSFSGSLTDDRDSIFGPSNAQRSPDFSGLGDIMGGSARFAAKSESPRTDSAFNFDSMFPSSTETGSKSSEPVYDKPVYDDEDDIFNGVPGLTSSTSKVKYEDVFSSVSSSPPKRSSPFDDLFGGFGKAEPQWKSTGAIRPEKTDRSASNFDDLLPGFGATSPPSERSASETNWPSETSVNATKTSSKVVEDPFVVPGQFSDPLEEISKLSNSGSMKSDSVGNGKVFEDVDPFDGLVRSATSFTSERDNRGKEASTLRADSSSSRTKMFPNNEKIEKPSVRNPDSQAQKKAPVENDWDFEMPMDSSNSHTSGQNMPPFYASTSSKEANTQADRSPTSVENLDSSEDIWLTVSEIPLFTQPTSAPPPSRPPPPKPVSKAGVNSSATTNARRKTNEFSSFPNLTQNHQVPNSDPAAPRSTVVSPVDELEDFVRGRSRDNVDENVNDPYGEQLEMNSAAAAMKEAMDRAEAKFRQAKEVRERESTKAARSKEAHVDRDEKSTQDERAREKQERFERQRLQREREEEEMEQQRLEKERGRARESEREREEKEREERRLERERERAREIEKERVKARQAVERATREARERAAAEARQRAERAAVDKATAEARERAERVAVQRAQAEARERAAADAKERAEKAAAEARERANSEAKEREARDRAATARADAEARTRAAERVAVGKAAAEARERAANVARANQQKNENDFESFFNNQAPSAPRPRNSSDPMFDTQFQNKQEPEATRSSNGFSSNTRKANSTTNIVDLTLIFNNVTPSPGQFQDVEGESEERRRARLERHQRTQQRQAKALEEKNQRDLQYQREQAERHRIAETLDVEIKRWAAGKEGNLRALLSTMQYVLWPESGWQPVSLTDMITAASVKKVYRKATLCIHPDKVQQKGATLQQKYVAEKVFDLLKEAWNKFNSEELF
ncbi:auxilin-related protein 2-like [Humulus lupulus]|uniref:auxilin-related protein 2-like n=1 Tax=Humulus lupulus TaxID=3486 RepID=UPI002B40FB28|nr:auxilin-related protein 2-like [Humulus lupulus]